jgi:hypothetical protein
MTLSMLAVGVSPTSIAVPKTFGLDVPSQAPLRVTGKGWEIATGLSVFPVRA